MTQGEGAFYLLPDMAAEGASLVDAADLGGLKPQLSWQEASSAFLIRDTFDQELRLSGRVLIEVAEQFELLEPDGRVLGQSSAGAGRFVAEFSEGSVKHALSDLSPLRCLLPVGAGEMRRGELALLDDEEKTQARAFLWVLEAAEGGRVTIARLQGLRGYDKALTRLQKLVEGLGGAALEDGALYDLLFPGQSAYVAKPDVPMDGQEEAFDAASDIIAAYLPVARANEAGVIADDDTEFLHDYRIALRKIRSVLSLFKGVYADEQTAELKARFSALMEPTGRLRDLDVYLLEKDAYYTMLPANLHEGLDRMFALFAEERTAAQAGLAKHLRSTGYRKEITALGKIFHKRKALQRGERADLPAYDFACKLIWKRYRKICTIAEAIDDATPDHEVHELRIHCKKLRYLMEFFGPLFPAGPFKKLIKPLKRLQDNLGLFNDYSVQQGSLIDFLRRLEDSGESGNLQVAQSVGALILVLHERQLAERAKVVGSFATFNSAETQMTFRELFHGGKK
ncbi:metal-binding protein [Salipiger sp. CCB-MM3]|uniref:CHAD domain-containing protein n=1 Tax=Salipiger sp. CCB-MM3 TaxID=1792508 RepID=UPI00080ABE3F|nr:CHAD domain-containing protein [Salipiger sp. CCB-MM3]ANT59607.1 metal-binding protein [Salipiger sp. CCB-MM3]